VNKSVHLLELALAATYIIITRRGEPSKKSRFRSLLIHLARRPCSWYQTDLPLIVDYLPTQFNI